MFRNDWKRCRGAALAGICSAGMVAAALAGGVASASAAPVPSQAPTRAPSQAPSQGQPSVRPRVAVPWSTVGSGWELVEYTNGVSTRGAAATVYLVSPGGARYSMYTWRASANFAPTLLDWSGDKTRALLFVSGANGMAQLNLRTGTLTHFTLPRLVHVIGYTRPSGLNILGTTVSATGKTATLARYSLTGKLVKVIATQQSSFIGGVDSADGATLAVSASTGLRLVSNAGGVVRMLPVPGVDTHSGCAPIRWWNSGTVLASCYPASSEYGLERLWLVPVNGAKPTALTPERDPSKNDLGDIDAWRLNSGLYLQSFVACATVGLNKQAANGSITKANVPGTPNLNTRVVTARGNSLLIDARTSCGGSDSLLWFNPGTRAEKWLFRTPAKALGVVAVIPFYTRENAPAL